MTTVTIEEAQSNLAELIDRLPAGEQVVITRDEQPVARLLVEAKSRRRPRRPGSAKEVLTIVSDDHEHLRDFAEYMG